MIAVIKKRVEIVRLLVQHQGTDINAKDEILSLLFQSSFNFVNLWFFLFVYAKPLMT